MAVNIRTVQYKLEALGGLILPTGSPASGKIWTGTDSNGNAEWKEPAKKKTIHEKGWSFYNVVPAEGLYPGFFIKISTGNVKKLIGVEYITSKGEVEFEIRKNAEAATGFTAITAASTEAKRTEPAALELTTKDYIRLKILKLTSTPENFAVTLFIETEA